MALPCFNSYKDSFYISDNKIVPYNINENFTEISLAFWIMDDGSKQGKGLHLNTYSFSLESIDRLLNLLEMKFELKCSIHLKENKPKIYISTESMENLRLRVSFHMHSSMLYKLDL
jgi:hypothetical protein